MARQTAMGRLSELVGRKRQAAHLEAGAAPLQQLQQHPHKRRRIRGKQTDVLGLCGDSGLGRPCEGLHYDGGAASGSPAGTAMAVCRCKSCPDSPGWRSRGE